ncbi:right-handed parallel beta-helix repeat-containing protein [Sulfitobacter sp. MF3-043]|uniref:right-handed parallel beta-helix repeat-containing protein n=1 Tax=Sulfitobacter sediminivivens TaxID=3252902 RepID=UPI0036D87E4B
MAKTRIVTAPLALASALFLLLAGPLAAAPACSGTDITTKVSATPRGHLIRNPAELSNALGNTQGGDVFELASGNYGALTITTAFRKPVTLRSADPKAPACFTELRLEGAKNVTLDGLVFDYAYTSGDKDSAGRFSIRKSHNILISNSTFDGDYKSGAGTGRGLRLKRNDSIILQNNVFRKWWKAVTGGLGTDYIIRGNEIYDIRSDGMAFGAVDGLTIEANHLHNFRGIKGGKDHRDMLQIMRASNLRSTNIIIRDNIFDMGAGDYAQTIWMGGDGKDLGDPMLRHQNVRIENNVIYNAHTHGISVHGIDNLSIRKNSIIRVRRAKSGKVTIPRINVSPGSTFVVIEQNVTSKINGYQNQKNWVVLNNALIQDTSPGAPGYYDREFIYYATGSSHGYHEYGVRLGSSADRLNAGSTLVKNYPTRR